MNGIRKYTASPVNARAALGVLLAGVLSVGAAVAAGPARATVGGANGQIAFALFNPAVGDNAVFTARPDGSDQREVFPGPAEGPRWSPTGSRIAMVCFEGNFEFVRNCTMNPDGSRFVQLRPDHPTLNQGVGPWSPDGARLAFEGWDDAHPDVVPGVFTMRSRDGGDLERVTSNPYGGHDIPADYAPNGRRLVFIRDDPSQDNDPTALFTVHLNGTGLRQITPWALSANDPRWSPSGNRIVFAAEGAIFLINPDGTRLVKIQQPARFGFSFSPVWSPDSTRILFASVVFDRRHPDGQEDLYTMNPNGSHIAQITDTPEFEESPDWGTYRGR
jgi:Tol biopolymer transport system component